MSAHHGGTSLIEPTLAAIVFDYVADGEEDEVKHECDYGNYRVGEEIKLLERRVNDKHRVDVISLFF